MRRKGNAVISAGLILLILASVSLALIVLQSILVLIDRGRQRALHTRVVTATITKIEEEMGEWYINAIWLDTKEQRMYTFRSPPLVPPATVWEGETIIVSFDPTQPRHYQMHI